MIQKAKMKQKQVRQLITKNMTIGEVISKHPLVIEPLQAAGVHCVGCGVSYVETLEEGFKSHGMSDQEINSLIEQLNESIKEEPAITNDKINLTAKAANKIKELLNKSNKKDHGLRIKVEPGGCAGYSYKFTFDKESTDDNIIDAHEVRIIIDNNSLDFIRGSKIDFVDSLQGSGFKIINPNAKSSCGCGQSFH